MTDWTILDDQSVTFPSVFKPSYVDNDYVQDQYVMGGYISYDVGDPTNVFTKQDKAGTSWL